MTTRISGKAWMGAFTSCLWMQSWQSHFREQMCRYSGLRFCLFPFGQYMKERKHAYFRSPLQLIERYRKAPLPTQAHASSEVSSDARPSQEGVQARVPSESSAAPAPPHQIGSGYGDASVPVSYTHLRAHETSAHL
eukprot:2799894-Alexandrium_andersonii.AAC.1